MFLIRMFQKRVQVDHLLDQREFGLAVDEEQMRVDRHGTHFSVVVFDCGEHDCESKSRQLAEACHRRLRMIDRAGFLPPHELALLLPGTDATGAQRVADDIASDTQGDGDLSAQKIKVYPETAVSVRTDDFREAASIAIHSADDLLIEPPPL